MDEDGFPFTGLDSPLAVSSPPSSSDFNAAGGSPQRHLVRKGYLTKVHEKQHKSTLFYLFNDLILYAKPHEWKHKIVCRIPLSGTKKVFRLIDLANTHNSNSDSSTHNHHHHHHLHRSQMHAWKIVGYSQTTGEEKSLTVYVSNPHEKSSWMTAILSVIERLPHDQPVEPISRPRSMEQHKIPPRMVALRYIFTSSSSFVFTSLLVSLPQISRLFLMCCCVPVFTTSHRRLCCLLLLHLLFASQCPTASLPAMRHFFWCIKETAVLFTLL